MPYTGPWITPPPQTTTIVADYWGSSTPQITTASFADACAGTGPITTIGTDMRYAFGAPNYALAQKVITLEYTSPPPPFSPPPPPQAVSVEYEGSTSLLTALSWITSLSTTLTVIDTTAGFGFTPEDVDLRLVPVHPSEFLYIDGTTAPPDRGVFRSATDVAARPIAAEASMPAATTSIALAITISTADIDVSNALHFFQFQLAFGQQLTGIPPGGSTGRVVNLVSNSHTGGQTLDVTYQPPRYRWHYAAAPRLRQFPRDDSLGGSPRQGRANGSTSVQGSTRQGWRGTYR